MLKLPTEVITPSFAVNMKVRDSKEQSTSQYSFHISCGSYLEWAGKKNADKEVKTSLRGGQGQLSDPNLIWSWECRGVL